jgi:hypothetical protein
MFETIDGPFSLTEVLTIAGPIDRVVSFNSSVVANVPEPSTWAMTLLGLPVAASCFASRKGGGPPVPERSSALQPSLEQNASNSASVAKDFCAPWRVTESAE